MEAYICLASTLMVTSTIASSTTGVVISTFNIFKLSSESKFTQVILTVFYDFVADIAFKVSLELAASFDFNAVWQRYDVE